jgi:hypothetical protein
MVIHMLMVIPIAIMSFRTAVMPPRIVVVMMVMTLLTLRLLRMRVAPIMRKAWSANQEHQADYAKDYFHHVFYDPY